MPLTYEHVGSKKPAKINTYMLTRAALLITLCYEIPCRSDCDIFFKCLFPLDAYLCGFMPNLNKKSWRVSKQQVRVTSFLVVLPRQEYVSCYLPGQLDLATMKGILLYVASVCPFNASIVIFWKIHIGRCALWQHRPDGQSISFLINAQD